MTAPQQAPAGWYADPNMVGTQRYWDGAQWSDQVRPTVDAPAVDASFAPTPGRPPGPAAPAAPVLIRKNTKRGKWGAAAVLALIAAVVIVPILVFLFLLIAIMTSGPALDDVSDATSEAVLVESRADYRFGEDAAVFFPSSEGVGEDAWEINISAPRDVTASVVDDNPAVTTPSDLGYLAFDIEATLTQTEDPTGAWFDMVVVGGATGREYWNAEPTAPCGSSPEQFVQQLPIGPETQLAGKICIPVQREDIGHPETRVELITPTGRAVFES